jgi:hypothetical protein
VQHLRLIVGGTLTVAILMTRSLFSRIWGIGVVMMRMYSSNNRASGRQVSTVVTQSKKEKG